MPPAGWDKKYSSTLWRKVIDFTVSLIINMKNRRMNTDPVWNSLNLAGIGANAQDDTGEG
jgi:hypothetical protein